jgi:hypothetical protein
MYPTYERPLTHPTAMKNPQENRHTANITASRTECTEEATHYETKSQIKRIRIETNRIEKSTQHSINMRKGEDSNSLRHGKPIEHSETRLQEMRKRSGMPQHTTPARGHKTTEDGDT